MFVAKKNQERKKYTKDLQADSGNKHDWYYKD